MSEPASVDAAVGALRERDLPVVGLDGRPCRMGIMGGTFDPIHYGHLVAAEQAYEDLGLDLVVFMPAGRPAFKLDRDVASGPDRYALTTFGQSISSWKRVWLVFPSKRFGG